MGQYKGGSAFYRVLHEVPVCAVIGAIIRGRGLPTALLPLVTQADEQPALQDLVENVQIAKVYSSKLKNLPSGRGSLINIGILREHVSIWKYVTMT